MSRHTVLAKRRVRISEMRKNPSRYFQDGPVAVLRHARTVGYMLSPELFEHMTSLYRQTQKASGFKARFRVSAARLSEIGRRGFNNMEKLRPEDIGSFSE